MIVDRHVAPGFERVTCQVTACYQDLRQKQIPNFIGELVQWHLSSPRIHPNTIAKPDRWHSWALPLEHENITESVCTNSRNHSHHTGTGPAIGALPAPAPAKPRVQRAARQPCAGTPCSISTATAGCQYCYQDLYLRLRNV